MSNPRVLAAMRAVPRELFVPPERAREAFDDRPLPIGDGQTISQPYVVALMTELCDIQPGTRVLEVGTGSGYQAAVLAELGAEVYSIEIHADLAAHAQLALTAAGYRVHQRVGDGFGGWPEAAPFDVILLTAAPARIPPPLQDQLAAGGRLIAPLGGDTQELVVTTRTEAGMQRRSVLPVRFVPMTGRVLLDPQS